jgi:hypothetical protein
MKTTNTNKYPQGYAEKIVYWTEQYCEAMSNEEREIAQNKIAYFTKRQNELNPMEIQIPMPEKSTSTKLDDKAIQLLIQENEDDYQIRIEKYIKDSDGKYNFQFLWTSGGFNDVWAYNKEEAIKIVANERKLKADPNTFVKATRSMADEQNRMGWMLSM